MPPEPVYPARHTFHSSAFESVVQGAVQFLNRTPVHPLPPAADFIGVGVYILYYQGTFDLYTPIARVNEQDCSKPIYVGKAVPRGWRTARAGATNISKELYGRLREHARSIRDSQNLEVRDFRCRFIILGGIGADLISTVEAALIRLYKPLWNTVINGFGNHDPGSGRYNQARSEWDVLHPGRSWADRLTGFPPHQGDIIAKIRQIQS